MVRHSNEEDIEFLVFDEPISDRPAILAAVVDAEKKELFEYGILTRKFFMIMQNGMINASINRTSFLATRTGIEKILNKMGRTMPKDVYEVAKFGPEAAKPAA